MGDALHGGGPGGLVGDVEVCDFVGAEGLGVVALVPRGGADDDVGLLGEPRDDLLADSSGGTSHQNHLLRVRVGGHGSRCEYYRAIREGARGDAGTTKGIDGSQKSAAQRHLNALCSRL